MSHNTDPEPIGPVQFKRALDSTDVSMVIMDGLSSDSVIVWVNEAFERITGYTADEVVGKPPRILLGPESTETSIRCMEQAAASRRSVTALIRNYRKDGTPFWNQMVLSQIDNGDANSRYSLAVQIDITSAVEALRDRERSIRLERRARAGLEMLARLSELLQETIQIEPIARLLGNMFGGWAAIVVDGPQGLAIVTEFDIDYPHDGLGLRTTLKRAKRSGAQGADDPVGALLVGRVRHAVDVELGAQWDPASATAQLVADVVATRTDLDPEASITVLPIYGRTRLMAFLVLGDLPEDQMAGPAADISVKPAVHDATDKEEASFSSDFEPISELSQILAKDERSFRWTESATTPGVLELGPGDPDDLMPGATHRFGTEDLSLLELATRRIGVAMDNVELYTREIRLAEALQRAMLPGESDVQDLEVWTYYKPSSEYSRIGGDWYDILTPADDNVCVVIGDIIGHDIEAAAAMSQLRSVVRAYAFDGHDPAGVLSRIDRLVAQTASPRLATMIYAVFQRREGAQWNATWARAGHLPIILVRGGDVEVLREGGGMLVGFGMSERESVSLELRPGDALVFFTDGLVERRERPLLEGLQELVRVVAEVGGTSAHDIGQALVEHMSAVAAEDDMTVVVVRVPDNALDSDDDECAYRLSGELSSISVARQAVRDAVSRWSLSGGAEAELVVSELVSNAVLHGWGEIGLRLSHREGRLRIEVEDFNPIAPQTDQRAADYIGGYGIGIVEQLADWGWRPAGEGKIVWAVMR